MRILIHACSDAQRLYLGRALTESLNSVETTSALHHAGYLLGQEPFDAVLLCAGGEQTFDELQAQVRTLRAQSPIVPLVMLFVHASPADCARFLRAGADACFVQPYSLVEIGERLHILERTTHRPAQNMPHTSHTLPVLPDNRHAPVRLDPATREFVDVHSMCRVLLTRREYLLLECLLREQGMPVSRERLTRYVWPEKEDVEPGSLNLMILRLRRKLKTGNVPGVIQTVNRHGYCLCIAAIIAPSPAL